VYFGALGATAFFGNVLQDIQPVAVAKRFRDLFYRFDVHCFNSRAHIVLVVNVTR
jgi:hypothetical protein